MHGTASSLEQGNRSCLFTDGPKRQDRERERERERCPKAHSYARSHMRTRRPTQPPTLAQSHMYIQISCDLATQTTHSHSCIYRSLVAALPLPGLTLSVPWMSPWASAILGHSQKSDPSFGLSRTLSTATEQVGRIGHRRAEGLTDCRRGQTDRSYPHYPALSFSPPA